MMNSISRAWQKFYSDEEGIKEKCEFKGRNK